MLIRAQFHPDAQVFFTEIDPANNRVRNIIGDGRFPYYEGWYAISDAMLLSRINTVHWTATQAAEGVTADKIRYCVWTEGLDQQLRCPHAFDVCLATAFKSEHTVILASDADPALRHPISDTGQMGLFKSVHWVHRRNGQVVEQQERPWTVVAQPCKRMAVPVLQVMQRWMSSYHTWRIQTSYKRGRKAWGQVMMKKHKSIKPCVFDTEMDL